MLQVWPSPYLFAGFTRIDAFLTLILGRLNSLGSFCRSAGATWDFRCAPTSYFTRRLLSRINMRSASLQVATARWEDFSQPSYCSFIMWQLAHDAGSFIRYDGCVAKTGCLVLTMVDRPDPESSSEVCLWPKPISSSGVTMSPRSSFSAYGDICATPSAIATSNK
jgi:hypothetical protein